MGKIIISLKLWIFEKYRYENHDSGHKNQSIIYSAPPLDKLDEIWCCKEQSELSNDTHERGLLVFIYDGN